MTLTFYTNPMSRGRIVRWMLEEVAVPYDTVLVDWNDKPAALLAANPLGKVPTIVHDGAVVTEGAAICAYLAAAFPDRGLQAEGAALAPYYRWLFYAAGPLEAAMMDRALGVEVPADKRSTIGYASFAEAVDAFEHAVKDTRYVCGDRFTAADVYVGSSIDFFIQFGTLERRDSFVRYVDRLKERAAWQRAIAIDDALIADAQGAQQA